MKICAGYPLTEREAEVAMLVANGKFNKEIARDLGLSLSTIKSHVEHVLTKTGATNRVELAAFVWRSFVS